MNVECWSAGAILMGIGCTIYGLRFRFGQPSAWLKAHMLSEYFNRNYPKLRRQSILGMIPAGLFFIFGGLAAIFEPSLRAYPASERAWRSLR